MAWTGPRTDTSHAHGAMLANVASLAADDIHAVTDGDFAFLHSAWAQAPVCARTPARSGMVAALCAAVSRGDKMCAVGKHSRAAGMRLPCDAQYVKMPDGRHGLGRLLRATWLAWEARL